MRLEIDTEAMLDSVGPLRAVAHTTHDIARNHQMLETHASRVTDPRVAGALGAYARSWRSSLASLADSSESLARMLETAAGQYEDTEQDVRRDAMGTGEPS